MEAESLGGAAGFVVGSDGEWLARTGARIVTINAIRSRFHSNGDGKVTSEDVERAKFKVVVTDADVSQIRLLNLMGA